MAALTQYSGNNILNFWFRAQTITPPSAVYLGLLTDAGEVSTTGTGYTRMQIVFSAATVSEITNTSDIIFPVATADWGVVTRFGLYSAASGGNMLLLYPLPTSRTVTAGSACRWRSGDLTLVIPNAI